MRERRRLGFAAPVVVVMACHAGAPVRPDPDEDTRRHRMTYLPRPVMVAVAADPSEVAPSPPPDADEVRRTTQPDAISGGAWPPAARPARVQRPIPPHDVCLDPGEAYRVYRVTCNPPRPPPDVCSDPDKARRVYGVRCKLPPPPPPTTMVADVIDVQVNDPIGVVLTIDAGQADGVDKGDRGVVIDAHDRPRRGGEFVVVKVTKQRALAKVKLTRAQVGSAPRVRITHEP